MRSSKSRSRSKSNRPRTLGNVVNRVFDSSGPEGKVRGTPTQIIEKYLFLARDAQLSNDRVAAENFLQHAEHYTRMLGEAQRELAEQDSRRPEGGYQQQGGQPQMRDDRQGDQPRDERPRDDRPRDDRPRNDQPRDDRPRDERPREERRDERVRDEQPEVRAEEPQRSPDPEVIDLSDAADDTGLVETPETRTRSRAPQRRRSAEAAQPQAQEPAAAETPQAEAPAQPAPADSGEAPAEKPERPRRPRGPRKPKASSEGGEGNTPEGDPREAAE